MRVYGPDGEVASEVIYEHGVPRGEAPPPASAPPPGGRLMAMQVTAGALCKCSFGVAPSALGILPLSRTLAPAPAASAWTTSRS